MRKILPFLLLLTFLSCKKETPIDILNWCDQDSIAFYGDSQLADIPYVTSIPEYFERMTGATVYHGGVSGETSTQVADRAVARKTFLNCPIIISAGRNNNWYWDVIIADYHRIIGNNPNYLIILVTNGDWPTETKGSFWNDNNDQFNERVINEFGLSHCINPKSLNDGLNDLYAEDFDVVAERYRADELHLNSLGNFEMTKLILTRTWRCQAAN